MVTQQAAQHSARRKTPSASTPKRKARVRTFESWFKLRAELDKLSAAKQWVFRGQEKEWWGLTHTLYRQFMNRGVPRGRWQKQERRIIRIFSRKAHLFLPTPPRDFLEWIALMQHHGAPTRLLDFTWSPYVAAFFALDNATEDEDAAIWAVNVNVLNQCRDPKLSTSRKLLPPPLQPWHRDPGLRHCFMSRKRTACIMSPFVMNQRLIAQSGTFLVPTVVNVPLDELLCERHHPAGAVRKLRIKTATVRQEALWDLYQMNINQATLFPGLDGLARSMAQELEVYWK